jgi:tRNA pseudouridine32 synthase / 23S rRNA pseudouridine746 synthase
MTAVITPAVATPPITAEQLLGRLLYRDALMLIIDKPAGLAVHPGPKGGPNLEDLLDGLRFGLPRRPELAHRLDRDTSGCLVLGRHHRALRRLGRLFAAGGVDKTYWAVVEGAPPAAEGRIDLPLGRRDRQRGWWMKVDPDGLPSTTDYRVLGRADHLTWLELRPLTGRTHQLRVHLAAVGCPVRGDPIYGQAHPSAADRPRLHLHARAIAVPLYADRPPIVAAAPPPAHMLDALVACGLDQSSLTPGPAVDLAQEPRGGWPSVEPVSPESQPANRPPGRPRRGHGFRRSHGPAEQKVNDE